MLQSIARAGAVLFALTVLLSLIVHAGCGAKNQTQPPETKTTAVTPEKTSAPTSAATPASTAASTSASTSTPMAMPPKVLPPTKAAPILLPPTKAAPVFLPPSKSGDILPQKNPAPPKKNSIDEPTPNQKSGDRPPGFGTNK